MSTPPGPDLMEQHFRRKAGHQRALLSGCGLYALTVCAVVLELAVVNTSLAVVVEFAAAAFIIAALLQVIVIPVFLLARLGVRHVPHAGLRRGLPWALLIAIAVILLTPAVMDRLRPERIMEEMSGLPVPPEAVVVTFQNERSYLESMTVLEFRVPQETLEAWVRKMRFSPGDRSGVETLGRLPYPGDVVTISVDWPRGILRLDYLDV